MTGEAGEDGGHVAAGVGVSQDPHVSMDNDLMMHCAVISGKVG